MNATQSIILVIEDNQDHARQLTDAINIASDQGADFRNLYLKYFPNLPIHEISDKEKFTLFLKSEALDQVALCLVDSELGIFRANENLPILNKDMISEVCSSLGIPVCVYSEAADEDDLDRLGSWAHRYIVIPRNLSFEDLAHLSIGISNGFSLIQDGLGTSESQDDDSLAQLGKILGMPEDAYSHLGLYSIGQVGSLPIKPHPRSSPEALGRFRSVSIGYWLYNSVLRYPGILLNMVALGSYLDIDPEHLKTADKMLSAFDEAKYQGPFHGVARLWWKSEIDNLLVEFQDEAAREYLKSKGFSEDIQRATCIDSGKTDGVGYFCIARNAPVCEIHSAGGHSWLPGGAVLSRISKSIWDELSPFYGL